LTCMIESDLTSFPLRGMVANSGIEYLTDGIMLRREREILFAVLQKTGLKIKGVDGAPRSFWDSNPRTFDLADRKWV